MGKQVIIDCGEPMVLDNDPNEALHEIAGYLRCITTRGREVLDGSGEVQGYWQTPEFLQGLLEIADECERIKGLVS